MQDVPTKYVLMQQHGATPLEVFVAIYKDDGHSLNTIRYVSRLYQIGAATEEMYAIRDAAFKVIHEKYVRLRNEGFTAEQILNILHSDRILLLEAHKVMRDLFNLSISQFQRLVVESGIGMWYQD